MQLLLFFLLILTTIGGSCNKKDISLDKGQQDLRINLRKDPASLDPRKGNDMIASQIHFMLFEGLLRLEPDMSLSPAQAESYTISPDGKTYTFSLKDTFWSDGSQVSAYDFEKSWKSMLSPDFPAPDAYLLYGIKNAKLAKQGKASLDAVGIYSKNSKTLIVELENPSPFFLQIVASSVLLPIHSHVEADHPHWATSPQHFISNGPFQLKNWQFNQKIDLEKNPFYHNTKEVKLNNISIEIIDREMAVLHMYASGHFDLIGSPLSFFPSLLHEDLEKKNLLTFFPVATSKFIAFNTTSPLLKNANLRKAFALAINRKQIVKHITQLKEKEALNIIPPLLLRDHAPPLFQDADDENARQCLELGLRETGLQKKDLENISFIYVLSEINHLLAQELQHRWLEVLGIKVELQSVEFKTIHERTKNARFAMALVSWLADYADPMNLLERFTDVTNHRNYSKWHNERYNSILKNATFASSAAEYLKKIQDAEQILIEEMPITCLYHDTYAFLINPRVKGFKISPLGHIYFEKISIEP